jgi:hypothetical protein
MIFRSAPIAKFARIVAATVLSVQTTAIVRPVFDDLQAVAVQFGFVQPACAGGHGLARHGVAGLNEGEARVHVQFVAAFPKPRQYG